jgi:SAM-dependent methyltransferase
MSDAVGVPQCPACPGGGACSPSFKKNGYSINRCADCGLLFVAPQPSPEELLAIYDADYFRRGNKYRPKSGEDPNRLNDQSKIELLHRYRTSGRLLDVGCAMGGFLQVAQESGFEVTGVEVAESAASHVRDNLGIPVFNCDLATANLPAESFDVVTMWDVIEHLPDPHPTLAGIHRILRPGGLLLFSTGDASSHWARLTGRYWHLMTPPQHLFFYTPQSARSVLDSNRFDCKEFLYPGKTATVDFILFKAGETFGSVVTPFRAAAQALNLDQLGVYVNLRDIMTAVAEKRYTLS